MEKNIPKKHLKFLQVYGKFQPSEKFLYVTIHPLADEPDILLRLGLAAEKCIICDLYWAVGKRLVFVSIWGNRAEPPSVAYREEAGRGMVFHKFVVRTQCEPLTTRTVERVLEWLAHWLESPEPKHPLRGKLYHICDRDIGE